MEQGPVLEALGVPLGLVSGIAGQTRLSIMISGTQVILSISLLSRPPPIQQEITRQDTSA